MAAFGISCSIQGKTCWRDDCAREKGCQMYQKLTGGDTILPTTNCHAGLYQLGMAGRAKIWIGREAAVSNHITNQPKPVQLIINCAAEFGFGRPTDTPEGVVMGNKAARALFPKEIFLTSPPVAQIAIDWPDFGTPPMDKGWWVRLNAALTNIDGDVILHCYGGHGRSGTAASILAVLNRWHGDMDPVLWLREVYCPKVVETDEQIIYIEEITGLKLSAEPAPLEGYKPLKTGTTAPWHSDPKGKTPTLSLRKWRSHVRAQRAKGKSPPTIDEMLKAGVDRIVVYNGDWFRFDVAMKRFIFVPPPKQAEALKF